MTAQELIQKCIEDKHLTPIVIAMIILVFWLFGRITSTECGVFMTSIGYTWDAVNHTISDGADTHDLYDMLTMACNDVYPAKAELGKFVMRIALKSAENAGYITAEQYTGLVALL